MARKPEVWKVKEEAVAWGFCLGQAGGGFVQASSYWMLSPLGAEVCVLRVGEVCVRVLCVCALRGLRPIDSTFPHWCGRAWEAKGSVDLTERLTGWV